MTITISTPVARSSEEIAALQAEIARTAWRSLNLKEMHYTLRAALDAGIEEELVEVAFSWWERYLEHGVHEAGVIMTAWWLAGNTFSRIWTGGYGKVWGIESRIHASDIPAARQIVDEALDSLHDVLADEAAAKLQDVLNRWQQFNSRRFQTFLRCLDEGAEWGRAPKRGTSEWMERVQQELLGS